MTELFFLPQAQIRLQQRHYQLSEALLRDVLRAAPDDRQALYHLSLVFATTNRSAESLLTARRAARGCVRPRAFCAALHAHLGDLLHTNAMLEAAVEVNPLSVCAVHANSLTVNAVETTLPLFNSVEINSYTV